MLTDDDAGKKIKVKATFADGKGNREGPVPSAAYPSTGYHHVTRATCDAPTYTGDTGLLWTAKLAVGKGTSAGVTSYGFNAHATTGYGELERYRFQLRDES